MKKILMFTHTDLDGHGCFIVAKSFCNFVRYYMCEPSNVEAKMTEHRGEVPEYDLVLLTDLSVSKSFAEEFHTYCKTKGIPFFILDHHPTAKELETLPFANITIEKDGKTVCGTTLTYDFFVEQTGKKDRTLEAYCEIVRQYDVWDWKKNDYLLPKQYNTLLELFGVKDFTAMIQKKLRRKDFTLSPFESSVYKIEETRIKNEVISQMKRMERREIQGYQCGIVFTSNGTPELYDEIMKDETIDIAISIGYYGCSVRTKKENIDVGQFAKQFGGGGHPGAGGIGVSAEVREKAFEMIFQKKE